MPSRRRDIDDEILDSHLINQPVQIVDEEQRSRMLEDLMQSLNELDDPTINPTCLPTDEEAESLLQEEQEETEEEPTESDDCIVNPDDLPSDEEVQEFLEEEEQNLTLNVREDGMVSIINQDGITIDATTPNGLTTYNTGTRIVLNNETATTGLYTNSNIYYNEGGNWATNDGSFGITGGQSVEYVNNCPREYPGLHPDLHDVYNSLLDSFGDNSISYEASRALRDALQNHSGEIQENAERRGMMMSYFEYLLEIVRNPPENIRFRGERTSDEEREKSNSHVEGSDLLAPVGFEYTYHAPTDKAFFRKITCRKEPGLNDAIGLLRVKLRDQFNTRESRIYNDAGLIEVCSPIHKTSKSVFDWFDKVDETCKSFKIMPHHKKKGSGGLHMNISINKDLEKWRETYINFFIMVANYPEINWILNEPSDNTTANSLQRCKSFVRAMYHLHATENKEDFSIENVWNSFKGMGGKSYAISCKDSYHFEMRCFEMPRTKEEMQDFLDFTDHLLKFSHKMAKENIFIPLLHHPISIFDNKIIYDEKEKTAIKDFNRLVKTIGLDPDRYRKYVRRNFKVRRDHYGKAFLT